MKRNTSRAKNTSSMSFKWNPKQWQREIYSMWKQWTPHKRSLIWKILGVSALMTWLSSSPKLNLVLSETALNHGHLWTPLTSAWVLQPTSPLFTLIVLGFIAAYKSGLLDGNGQIKRPRYFGYAAVIFIILSMISSILPNGLLWSLLTEGLSLIWFARDLERRWGRSTFLKLTLASLSMAYCLGAIYLFLFGGQEPMHGMHPLTRGFILAWGYYIGPHQLSFLNIRGDQLRWVIYAFCGFELLLLPPPFGLITLSSAFFFDQYVRGKLPNLSS